MVVLVTMLMAVLLYLDRFCVGFAEAYIREDLNLTHENMSWFLSVFFWSYGLGQVPAGWWSDRYGARAMLTIYILTWSVFTALTGMVHGFEMLIVMRLGCGLGQAGAYPTASSTISKWVPFSNRGFASSVVAMGGRVGGAIAPILTAWLILLFVPLDVPAELTPESLLNGADLCAELAPASGAVVSAAGRDGYARTNGPAERIWSLLSPEGKRLVERIAVRQRQAVGSGDLSVSEAARLTTYLNSVLSRPDLYEEQAFTKVSPAEEAVKALRDRARGEELTPERTVRLNRLLLEAAFKDYIGKLYVRGWRPVLYVYGLAGIAVAGLYWLCVRDRPEKHPWTNQAERDLIAAGRPAGAPGPHGGSNMPGSMKLPLRELINSRSMWFNCLMQVGTNIGWVFLVSWLARYLMYAHEAPILERGWMAFTPLAVGIAGMLIGGKLTDVLVRAVGLRWGRRLPMMVTRFTAAAAYLACIWFASQPDD